MTPFACRNAARSIQQGKVIAYPTEAVFGLGCHPLDAEAVKKILKIKQRPVSKGLILIASDFSQLRPYVADVPDALLEQALNTWPGPNTWLFPKNPATPIGSPVILIPLQCAFLLTQWFGIYVIQPVLPWYQPVPTEASRNRHAVRLNAD